jgi:hypothetical protein
MEKARKRLASQTCAAITAGIFLALGVSTDAGAQRVPGYPDNIRAFDPREVRMLPNYCIYTQDFRENVPGGDDPAQTARWNSVMGEIFIHMHHYCYGLMKSNRANLLATDRQVRSFYWKDAIDEFNYVLAHATDEFVLMPEILTKKGENLIRLGQGPLGIIELERAAELKPDYWPAYAAMSDYYKDSGDPKKARELLQSGLSFAPEAQGLKRRLAELDAESARRRPTSRAPSNLRPLSSHRSRVREPFGGKGQDSPANSLLSSHTKAWMHR